jgi:hypothetical protein
MFTWISKIKKWDSSTLIFAFVTLIFVSPIVLTGVYCYLRLDFVRSYDKTPEITIESKKP